MADQNKQVKSLRELLKEPNVEFIRLLDKDEFTQELRYQTKELQNIITYENSKQLIKLIIEQGPPEDTKLSYKFPLVASEALCLQIKNLSQYFFEGDQQREPLMEYMLRFLKGKDNYVLAAYFSKVLIAIIKRFNGNNTKYNQKLCQYLFAPGLLEDLTQHFYSRSIVDLLFRILTLRSKQDDYLKQKKAIIFELCSRFNELSSQAVMLENLVYFFQSLVNNEYSQKINYELSGIAFDKDILDNIFGSLGAAGQLRRFKTVVVNLYLNKFISLIVDNHEENLRIIGLSYLTGENGITRLAVYVNLVIEYISYLANENIKVRLQQIFLLEAYINFINLPLPSIKNIIHQNYGVVKHLFQIIKQNPWNNILHNVIIKLTKSLITEAKAKQNYIQNLLETLSQCLIGFMQISVEEKRQKVGYCNHIEKISEEVFELMLAYKYQKSQEWAQFEIKIYQLITRNNQYQVGDYSFKPYFLSITYNPQNIQKVFANFLSKPVLVQYEEKQSKITKEKQFEEYKTQKIAELVQKQHVKATEQQSIEIIKFEVEEEFEPYKYWKENSHIKYNLEELINEI